MTAKTKTFNAFLKIGQEAHIDELQKKGHLYCNTLSYFRSLEENGLRGDRHEGMSLIKQVPRLDLLIESKIAGTSYSAQLYADDPKLKGNIFCLYGFESSKLDHESYEIQNMLIEEANKEFGEYALIIHNTPEFIKRLTSFLQETDTSFEFEPVCYYDPLTTNAHLDQYCKSNIFDYQNEVRLWLPNDSDAPMSIKIGNLSDISFKLHVKDLDKLRAQFIRPE